jgi:hypothetical protein
MHGERGFPDAGLSGSHKDLDAAAMCRLAA